MTDKELTEALRAAYLLELERSVSAEGHERGWDIDLLRQAAERLSTTKGPLPGDDQFG